MLIATLPPVHQERLLKHIIEHPSVDAVRYNTGVASAYDADETLTRILALTRPLNKQLWLDLKGRQLRITEWAVPNFGKIVLNHAVSVDYPAQVYFRGNECSSLKVARGNLIYVDPPPRYAVGAGQAINIVGQNLKIEGYLTDSDHQYIKAAKALAIKHFMLSFVESNTDITEFYSAIGVEHTNLNLVLKIESLPGLAFVRNFTRSSYPNINLMAARDDLMINIGENRAEILPALVEIIAHDPQAIVASRLFAGLEGGGSVTMGDFADLYLMQLLGYQEFMLSDGICNQYFDKAIQAWQDFQSVAERIKLTPKLNN